MYFWDGKKGAAKAFSGDRTEEGFMKFLKENSSQFVENAEDGAVDEEDKEVEL